MGSKIVINLDPPMPASDDCLPHAAMTLGSVRGVSTRPRSTLVYKLIIEEQPQGFWMLYRMDEHGGFIGDTSHPTKQDAVETARKEFRVDVEA